MGAAAAVGLRSNTMSPTAAVSSTGIGAAGDALVASAVALVGSTAISEASRTCNQNFIFIAGYCCMRRVGGTRSHRISQGTALQGGRMHRQECSRTSGAAARWPRRAFDMERGGVTPTELPHASRGVACRQREHGAMAGQRSPGGGPTCRLPKTWPSSAPSCSSKSSTSTGPWGGAATPTWCCRCCRSSRRACRCVCGCCCSCCMRCCSACTRCWFLICRCICCAASRAAQAAASGSWTGDSACSGAGAAAACSTGAHHSTFHVVPPMPAATCHLWRHDSDTGRHGRPHRTRRLTVLRMSPCTRASASN